MPSTEKIQTPWIDIQALPVPDTEISIGMLLMIIAGLVLLLAVMHYTWRRPKRMALRTIRHLHRKSCSSRQKLFLLKQALQQGLQEPQLQKIKFDSHLQSEWQAFCHLLFHSCYQKAVPASDDVSYLTAQARYWIKQA